MSFVVSPLLLSRLCLVFSLPQTVLVEIVDGQGFDSLCQNLLLLFSFGLLLASPLVNL